MKRIVVGLALAVVAIGLVIAIASAVVNEFYLTPDRVERLLTANFGREVVIGGSVDFSFWREPRVTVSQLHLKNAAGSSFKHLATLDSVSVGLRWWDLPALMASSLPHFLDIEVAGGKVHVDSRQDVVGDDGVWPSADDPFTGALGWIDSLEASDLRVEVQVDHERVRQIELQQLDVSFDTGEDGTVIIDAENLDLTIAGVDVEGSLKLEAPIVRPGMLAPATLTGKLEVGTVDVASLLDQPPASGPSAPLDDPLPVHDCLSWDTDLDLSIGSVRANSGEITDLHFDMQSSEGHWRLRLVAANFPAGRGEGEVSLHCGRLPGRLNLQSNVRSRGKSQFGQSGTTVEMRGRMESILTLAGEGSTWKELVGDFDGRFAVFLGPVQTDALEDRFYARNLFHALTVSWGQSRKAVVDCAVFDMHIEKGLAKSRQIVIGTPTLVINGHGQVELVENRVDIVLIPHAKHPRLGKVHAPVLISGSIQDPHFGLDWKDVLPRLVVETGYSLINPIFDSLPFEHLDREEREACRRSLEPLEVPTAAMAD